MGQLIDRIRKRMGCKSFVSADKIKEVSAEDPTLAGYTFKSFDSLAPKKTAADFVVKDMAIKFAFATTDLAQAYQTLDLPDQQDPFVDPKSSEDMDKFMGDTPANAYGLDPEKLGPRKEWIEKKEKAQVREIEKEGKAIERQQLEQEKELKKQQEQAEAQAAQATETMA